MPDRPPPVPLHRVRWGRAGAPELRQLVRRAVSLHRVRWASGITSQGSDVGRFAKPLPARRFVAVAVASLGFLSREPSRGGADAPDPWRVVRWRPEGRLRSAGRRAGPEPSPSMVAGRRRRARGGPTGASVGAGGRRALLGLLVRRRGCPVTCTGQRGRRAQGGRGAKRAVLGGDGRHGWGRRGAPSTERAAGRRVGDGWAPRGRGGGFGRGWSGMVAGRGPLAGGAGSAGLAPAHGRREALARAMWWRLVGSVAPKRP